MQLKMADDKHINYAQSLLKKQFHTLWMEEHTASTLGTKEDKKEHKKFILKGTTRW